MNLKNTNAIVLIIKLIPEFSNKKNLYIRELYKNNMSKSLRLTIKPSVFHKAKLLLIEPDLLELDYVNTAITNNIKMTKFDIAELRYGVKAINGYRLRIGRIYCIDIKNITGEIIKIRLSSLYGINKKKLEKKYVLIVQTLFENYFNNIISNYLHDFQKGKNITILNTAINYEGIVLYKDAPIIHWNAVDTKRYWSYFTIFSAKNENQYKAYEYRTEWNATILYSIVNSIATYKKNEKKLLQ